MVVGSRSERMACDSVVGNSCCPLAAEMLVNEVRLLLKCECAGCEAASAENPPSWAASDLSFPENRVAENILSSSCLNWESMAVAAPFGAKDGAEVGRSGADPE